MAATMLFLLSLLPFLLPSVTASTIEILPVSHTGTHCPEEKELVTFTNKESNITHYLPRFQPYIGPGSTKAAPLFPLPLPPTGPLPAACLLKKTF